MAYVRATPDQLMEAALEAAGEGLPVMPLHSSKANGACTCGRKGCPSPGKHPRVPNGLLDATTDEAQIKAWWKKWPTSNIAVVGGANLCLDIDVREANGLESLEELIEDNGPLPHTAVAETGSYNDLRGQHYYFRVPDGVQVRAKTGVRPGVDIRAARSYWILPPSRHSTGVPYEWIEGTPPLEERAEAPEWILDLCSPDVPPEKAYEPVPGFRMARDKTDFLKGRLEIEIGEQRLFLVEAARSFWRMGFSVQRCAELLWSGEEDQGGICASEWGEVPWTEEDMYEIAADIYGKAPSTSMETNFEEGLHELSADLGLAKRLADSYPEGHLFYLESTGKFFVWDEERKRFKEDGGYLLKKQLETVVVPQLKMEAAQAQSSDRIKQLWKQSIEAQKRSKIDNCIYLLPQFCRRETEEIDADPFILGCTNGTLDLRTGELKDSEPADLLTRRCRAAYNPKAKSKVFDNFLKQIVPDRKTRDYLQLAFGYSLTGSVREHKFFFVHGPPGSGKGTLVETFAYLMGSYATSAEPSTFMLKQNASGSAPSEDIARLAGVRFIVTSEPEQGSKWASAQLSKLTGGDEITARFLHQASFSFFPEFKLWFTANHRPRVGSARSGVWRRMKVVEIPGKIEKPDTSLRDVTMRTAEVLEAFLAWAVKGAIRWHEENYLTGAPIEDAPEVAEATEEYAQEEDQVGRFLAEVVKEVATAEEVAGDKSLESRRVAKALLYKIYTDWASQEGIKMPKTKKSFGSELKDRGYPDKLLTWGPDRKVALCWTGIRLRDPWAKIVARNAG